MSGAYFDGSPIVQHADAVLDYLVDLVDLAEWLDGETLATSVCVGTGCAASVISSTATAIKVRIASVTANAFAVLTVNTASGQRELFRLRFEPR